MQDFDPSDYMALCGVTPFVPDPVCRIRALLQTCRLLQGTRLHLCRYELHHGVRISDSALVDAAVLSDRYIADRFLPDKAIDLVSCSYLTLSKAERRSTYGCM